MKIYDVSGIGASLTGSFSGSFKGLFTGPLDGVAATSSYVEYSNVANKPTLVSGSSQITYSGLTGVPSGIVSGSTQIAGLGYATTSSNTFIGNQTITGSILGNGSLTIDGTITSTGQIVAQTINVQQVTSSIVYSCGSNVFGTSIGNTQKFTGSMFITGSNLNANVGSACFQGSVCAPVAIFSGCVGIGITTPCHKLDIRNASGTGAQTIVSVINKTNDSNTGAFIGFGDAYTDTISPYLFAARVGGTREGAGDGGFMSFYTRPTSGFEYERMRITSTGITCFACRVCMPSATVAGTLTLTASPGVYDANLTYIGTTYNFGPGEASDTVDFKICGGIASTTGNRFGFWTQAGNATPVERLRIDKNGIACFACQVCAPHLVGLNNISIGSNCTSTDGYNTRLRITSIANDTFVFAFNNQACRPIMFMYGGNTNNPHGYTAWLDNTSGLQNHSLSHVTTESTYFAAQGGRVGVGTTSPNTKFEVVGGSQCTPGTSTSNYTMALRDPTSMVCGVGGSILLQGYKTGTAAIGNFAYIAGKKENGTAGNEAGYLALGTFDSEGLAYERVKITSAGTVIFNCNNSYCSNYGYNFLEKCNGSMLSGAHIMGNVGVNACATPFWCNGGNFRMEFNWSSGAETQWINHNNCAPFKLLWSADNYANKYCFGYNGTFWASNSVYATTLTAGSVLTVGAIGHYQNYRNTSGCFAIFCASQGAILYVTSMHNNGRSTAIVSYANGVTAGAAISVVNQVTPYGPAALSFGVCANGWVYGYSQYGGPMDFYAISMNSTFAWGF